MSHLFRVSFREYDSQENLHFIPRQCSRLGLLMFSSPRRIISLFLVRFSAWLLQKLFRVSVSPAFILITLIILPTAITFFKSPNIWQDNPQVLLWIAYFSSLLALLIRFPRISWLRLVGLSDAIDSLFINKEDEEAYIKFVERRLKIGRQLFFSVLCTEIILFVFLIGHADLMQGTDIWGAIVLVALNTMLGSNAVYWLWSVPNFIVRLSKFPALNLSVLSPAHTPSVLALSRLLGTSTLFATIGATLFGLPIVYYGLTVASVGGIIIILVVSTLSLATVLYVALSPQYSLARMARRHREQTLDSITKELQGYKVGMLDLPTNPAELARVFALTLLYQQVQRAPNLAVQTEVMVKYAVGFASLLSPIATFFLRAQQAQ